MHTDGIGAQYERDISSIFCMFIHSCVDQLVFFIRNEKCIYLRTIHLEHIWWLNRANERTNLRMYENLKHFTFFFDSKQRQTERWKKMKKTASCERQQIILYIKLHTHPLNSSWENPHEKYREHLSHTQVFFCFFCILLGFGLKDR